MGPGFLGMAVGWGKKSGLEFGELASKVNAILKSLESVRDESMNSSNWHGDDKLEFVNWCADPGLPALRGCNMYLQLLSGNFVNNAGQQAQASARHS
jgi:hypothetical protein